MNRLFLTLFFLLLAKPPLYAENGSETLYSVDLHGGIGYGIYRDLGASPLTYRGLQLHPGISFVVQKPDMRYEAILQTAAGAYGLKMGVNYIQAYGGHPLLGFRVWRKHLLTDHFNLWYGGSVDDLFDTRYNRSLGNACVGFGNFLRFNIEGCVTYSLRNWLFHAGLQLNAFSLNMRPGFAYMDNYDQNIASSTANTFDQYHAYPAAATGATTDMGLSLKLAGGNRVGLSYRWSYLSSRTTADGRTAPHLFQTADHALLFHLGFRIN